MDAVSSIRERLPAGTQGEDPVTGFATTLPGCLVDLRAERVGSSNIVIVGNGRGGSLEVQILGPGKFKTAKNKNLNASPSQCILLQIGGGVERDIDQLVSELKEVAANRPSKREH